MLCVSQDSLPDSTLLALRLCEIMSSTFVISQGLNEILSFDQSSQYARLLGDSSGSSSWNPTLIVLINAAWIVVAILLTVCFCRKCDGAEQFATWASTSSDIQYARNRMAQRLAEAEAKKSAPDKQRELLKKSWNRNQVTMVSLKSSHKDGYFFLFCFLFHLSLFALGSKMLEIYIAKNSPFFFFVHANTHTRNKTISSIDYPRR